MNFNELKVIWDSQNHEPLYAIDRKAMHARIKSEGREIEFCLNMFEIISVAILLGLGLAVGLEPLIDGRDYHQFIDATFYLAAGTYLARELRRRKRAEAKFEDSLLGDLDRAIFQVEVQIRRFKVFPWIVLGPMVALSLLKLPLYHDTKPLWLWPITLGMLLVTFHSLRHELKQKKEPHRQSLQTLRAKLTAPAEGEG